jgi:hypothetical protein
VNELVFLVQYLCSRVSKETEERSSSVPLFFVIRWVVSKQCTHLSTLGISEVTSILNLNDYCVYSLQNHCSW